MKSNSFNYVNHIQTTPRLPSFWQGVICHLWVSQFIGHREQTRGVRLSVKVAHHTVSKQQFLHKSDIFSKEEAWIKKRKMLCYSPLVGGQNSTPVLGLCHFISEKNVVQAPRVFKVNSYIELSRFMQASFSAKVDICQIFRIGPHRCNWIFIKYLW